MSGTRQTINPEEVAAKKNEQRLALLLKEDANRICADCGQPGTRWAAWNLGVFLCIRCGGVHRRLGTHISRVKSVTLDRWTDEQVENMQTLGNARVNADLIRDPARFPFPTHSADIEQYIRDKYDRRLFSNNPLNSSHTPTSNYSPKNGPINSKNFSSSTVIHQPIAKGREPGRPQSYSLQTSDISSSLNSNANIISKYPAQSVASSRTVAPVRTSIESRNMYPAQMRSLIDMGFTVIPDNKIALASTNGNVEASVEWLVSRKYSSGTPSPPYRDASNSNKTNTTFSNPDDSPFFTIEPEVKPKQSEKSTPVIVEEDFFGTPLSQKSSLPLSNPQEDLFSIFGSLKINTPSVENQNVSHTKQVSLGKKSSDPDFTSKNDENFVDNHAWISDSVITPSYGTQRLSRIYENETLEEFTDFEAAPTKKIDFVDAYQSAEPKSTRDLDQFDFYSSSMDTNRDDNHRSDNFTIEGTVPVSHNAWAESSTEPDIFVASMVSNDPDPFAYDHTLMKPISTKNDDRFSHEVTKNSSFDATDESLKSEKEETHSSMINGNPWANSTQQSSRSTEDTRGTEKSHYGILRSMYDDQLSYTSSPFAEDPDPFQGF